MCLLRKAWQLGLTALGPGRLHVALPKKQRVSFMASKTILAACVGAAMLLLPASIAAGPAVDSVSVFDTRTPLPGGPSARVLADRAGWTRLAEDDPSHTFEGDAVVSNGRLTLVLRRGAPGAELYAHGKRGPTLRAALAPVADGSVRLASVLLAENTAGEAAVDAVFRTPDGRDAVVRFALALGAVFVKSEPRRHVESLQVEAPCQFVVMPDFFADDLVVDAAGLPPGVAELPGDGFLMHMVGRGDAIVLAIRDRQEKDFGVEVAQGGGAAAIRASQIPYGTKGSVYVAVLEGPAVWHRRDVAGADAGRIVPLRWRAPFVGQWRVDWRRADGLTDSWEMLLQKPDGHYVKPDWFGQSANYGTDDWMGTGRRRWTTVLGHFDYPCWIDNDGRAFLQPLKKPGEFEGPALVYPLNRVAATPLTALTVVDLMRATLSVGPCQYVLDVEGQKKRSAGIPTCDARSLLNGIYERRQQRERRAEVVEALDDALAFMRHIRARIEDYVAFGRRMRDYLARQKDVHPELADFLSEMEAVAARIDAAVAARADGIHTPAYAARLVDEFRTTLVDCDGDDALARCKKLTAGFVEIGGNQDELVGECRVAVRILRQKAALAMAADPQTAEVAKEIRRRTQQMLRNPTSYEAPRH